MIDVKQIDGKWFVLRDGKVIAGPLETNSEAWRTADRASGEPVSRSEKVSEWIWNQT